jgi:hypothetical protein
MEAVDTIVSTPLTCVVFTDTERVNRNVIGRWTYNTMVKMKGTKG